MIQKPKISLLLLIHNESFHAYKTCFETIGIKYVKKEKIFTHDHLDDKIPDEWIYTVDGIEIELLFCNLTGDRRFSEYTNSMCMPEFELNLLPAKTQSSNNIGCVYNMLLRRASGTHICILQPYIMLSAGWLLELLSYSQMISKCGMVCLANSLDGKTMQSLTDNDCNFINVFVSPEDKIDGIYLYNKEYLNYIGAFYDENNLYGLEPNHYAHRSSALGLNNFYIPTKFGIQIVKQKEIPVKGFQNYDLSIEYMSSIKNWYYKL